MTCTVLTRAAAVLKMSLPKRNSKTLRVQATTHSQKTPNKQKSGYANTAAPLHKEKWYGEGGGWRNGFVSSLGTDGPFLSGSSLAQDSHTDSSHHICAPDSQKEVGKKRHLLSKGRTWWLLIVYWPEHSHMVTHSCKGGWEV